MISSITGWNCTDASARRNADHDFPVFCGLGHCLKFHFVFREGGEAQRRDGINALAHLFEPTVVVVSHDLAGLLGIGGLRHKRCLGGAVFRQYTCTAQGILTVGGHQAPAGRAALVGITNPFGKFLQQAGSSRL